jgi:hypothetical protein
VLDKWRRVALIQTFSEALDYIWGPANADTAADAPVLLVSSPGTLNFAATLAFSAYLMTQGIVHRVLPEDSMHQGKFSMIDDAQDVHIVCLCYLSAPGSSQLDYSIRRIKRQAQKARVVVVAWEKTEGREDILDPMNAKVALAPIGESARRSPPRARKLGKTGTAPTA